MGNGTSGGGPTGPLPVNPIIPQELKKPPGPGEKGYDPLAVRKALFPNAVWQDEPPTSTGPDFTYRSTGVIKGTTTTTPGKSTYTYKGKKSSGVYDALNKEISGGLAKRKYGYEGTDVKEYEQLKLAKRKGQAGVGEVKGKDVVTNTPDQTINISQKFSPDSETADKNDGGSAITTDVPNDDTTKPGGKKGGMPEILAAATGTGGNTKINRSNPVDGTPVSDGSSADPTFKAGLQLNNQAVNKA